MPTFAPPAEARPATALWIVGAGRAELRREALPALQQGEVCVAALHSAVSRGTESLVLRGGVPASQYPLMRAPHQVGDFPWPVKYGYASVGRVVEGDAALRGREVFCLHPHQDRYVVAKSSVLPLPEGVPPARAVLAANMETALNAVWDAQLAAGDRVLVIGAGVVGLLVAYLAAAHPGTEVAVADVDPRKRQAVEALGLCWSSADGLSTDFDADVVFHASGHPAGLRGALSAAGAEATVVELSWFGDREVGLPLGEAFHSRRLRVLSSQVGQVPAHRRPRFSRRRRLSLALGLLTDPRLDGLVSAAVAFAQLPAALCGLLQPQDATLCLRVDYESEV